MFRVLIAVHRPRYRSRIERALRGFDWDVRSLLTREDPIGLINQKPPHLFFLSDDFGRQKELGILRAAQKYRGSGMKVIGVLGEPETAEAARALCDSVLALPWKTEDAHALAVQYYLSARGEPPIQRADEAQEE